jgi:hypothetical protein
VGVGKIVKPFFQHPLSFLFVTTPLQPSAIVKMQRVVVFWITVMDQHSPPQISSFVLRFVQDESVKEADQTNYRGSIRHIQTDQEISFTCWSDALDFIGQFIPGEVLDPSKPATR